LEDSEDEDDPLFCESAEDEHDSSWDDSDDEYDLPLSRRAKSHLKSAKSLRDEAEVDVVPKSSAEKRRIWKKTPVPENDVDWKGQMPSPDSSLVTPIAFFQKFFDSEIISILVEEMNRYALQEKGLDLKCTIK
jgi:hypothetical protein